jgi:hypothetical protein
VTIVPVADNDPTEFDETVTFTLQSGSGYFLSAPTAGTITIHDDTPYNSTWASQFPGFSGAIAAPTADPEDDGIANLLKFAFNGDPFHSDRNILPVPGKMNLPDPADNNIVKPYPTLSFARRTDAPGLNYFVEISSDMKNWTSDVEQVSASADPSPNMQDVVYRGLTPLSGNGQVTPVFFRVRVAPNDPF